ncbi:MAG TPA: cache domain-containing protein [Candidatus Paceibacterota bacterium]|nr:cache domain-containing protein [Candidatus Paceibacterota bacterium]HRT58130.1 cache domain-containing protein [Candidatus Paceibacterota bacterium]
MNRIRQILFGLRFRLLLLVLVACAPLAALTLHRAWEERERQVANWQRRAQQFAELALEEEENLLASARQLLFAVAESPHIGPGSSNNPQKTLEEFLALNPQYANLGVVNTNGQLLASTAPAPRSLNLAGESFFRRAVESLEFSVGDIALPPQTPRPTLTFSRPVLDSRGQLTAVVFATIELNFFEGLYSQLRRLPIPRDASWTLINTNGLILARYPGPKRWVGRESLDAAVVARAFESPGQPFEAPGPDGRESIYAFALLPTQLVAGDARAVLCVPRQVLFAQANRTAAQYLTWLGLAGGIALLLGWVGSNVLVIQPIKALVQSSTRLARGDLSARTGLRHGHDELGQLTLSFDLMAQALEQRERERQRASLKLQVLSHRLVEVQESERRHIARELHDEIGQTLTVAEMNLQAALQSPEKPALERRLEESIRAVERVLEQVHDLSLNLRPSMLDDLGLEPALRWYTQRQAELAGLTAEFHPVPLDKRPPPVIETECFRVAQEALTNVVRHAQARSVVVTLTQSDGCLRLSVRDDGCGFEVAQVRNRAVHGASLGVLSMEERATLAGGGLEIISAPGQGTEVRAWFPLDYHRPQELALETQDL